MARGRASLLILAQLLTCCAAVHGEPQCDAADVSCKASPSPRSLLQVRNAERTETTSPEEEGLEMEQALRQRAASPMGASALVAMDAACAAHIQANRLSPEKVGQSVMAGVAAIQAAAVHFMATPPNVGQGISTLATDMFVAVEGLVPDSTKSTDGYKSFRTAWMTTFQELPTTVQSIQDDINAFIRTGAADKLVRAIETILVEAVVVATRYLPQQTGNELAKYIGAVSDVFGGIGDGIAAFNTGDSPAAIEAIYKGLRDATNDLVPAHIQNDDTYKAIIAVLDATLGSLSKHVMEYTKLIENSNCCWRGSMNRERERPRACPTGYTWDGVQWCLVLPRSLLLDTAVTEKKPEGALPAVCSASQEKQGGWCYKDCQTGYETSGSRCKVSCGKKFPIESPEMCGTSNEAISSAIMQMIAGTFTQLITMWKLIEQMEKKQLDLAKGLKMTMQTLIDMGKPFARPPCPADR